MEKLVQSFNRLTISSSVEYEAVDKLIENFRRLTIASNNGHTIDESEIKELVSGIESMSINPTLKEQMEDFVVEAIRAMLIKPKCIPSNNFMLTTPDYVF